ncbi:M20/M25/M40 family metallo-hydrolase [Actinotalea caeni]|uniref:M20/M25/M40 family metallo-hydrolase n=1 Tax=Actinotalea caeni TaxID=1348467 RepID=UPI0012E1E630|nr:M20/M25/M40 family metallo-hydrolase [Actinotalea caeni]
MPANEDRTDVQELRDAVARLMPQAREELATLVGYRSVADPAVEDPEQCRLAARWVRDAFAAEGLDARLVTTPDGSDAVIATHDGPAGAPRVLLYAHYDVQPAPASEWTTPPFELTERDGRWYGRGAADCKGSIVAHLAALRAVRARQAATAGADAPPYPVSLTVVVEGSEEQGTGGLERHVEQHPEDVAADVVVIGDVGNVAVGVPTLTVALRGMVQVTVRVTALDGNRHSGAFGGPTPDALAALVAMLASLRDAEGNTTIDGLDATGTWDGAPYPAEQLARDAGIVEGARVIGSGSVADHLWARPAVTIIGIDAPPVVGALPAIQGTAAATVSLRVPPGTDAAAAEQALIEHLRAAAPWGVQVSFEREGIGQPFAARQDTRGFEVLSEAMADAFGAPVQTAGQGGSIPLTAAIAAAHPDASVVMIGVSEPASRMHSSDESVDPGEIERMALAEALLLTRYRHE